MANYWAIEIGIHQYRFLPALNYAQRDAELLHQFLIQAGGFAADRCALLSDAITVTASSANFPSAENIYAQVTQCCQQVKPNDFLLCFFSGYGLKFQGKDYLLPIEADLRSIAATAIPMDALLQALQTAATQNIVLILDANRSQFGWEYGGFGEQTAQLAQERKIAVLLSCHPQQFSHEPLTLRQGIFTTALLAALQEGVTLEQVVEVLSIRLPQLSEECWRPRQDLVSVVPPHLRYQILLPEPTPAQQDRAAVEAVAEMGRADMAPMWFSALRSGSAALLSRTRIYWQQTVARRVQDAFERRNPSNSITSQTDHQTIHQMIHQADPSALMLVAEGGAEAVSLPRTAVAEADTLLEEWFWRRLLLQSGLIGGILLLGVLLRNSRVLIKSDTSLLHQLPTAVQQPTDSPQPAVPSPSAAPVASSPAEIVDPVVMVDPALLLQSAQAAFAAQQYEEANRQLVQVPITQRTAEHNQLLEQTNRELLNKAKTMLIRSRQMMPENQASDLVEAVKVARLIKSDQPLHLEAQQQIDRWSRVVMDMAQGRAERPNSASVLDAANNYSLAIAAAQLVPSDQPKVKEQAQQSIALWSQMILDLANEQAAKGNLDLAIQVGEQVPPHTPIYAQALESIASWRNQPVPQQLEEATAPAEGELEVEY
jgi:hypothetical protein